MLAAGLAAGAARGFDESADGERTREPAPQEKVEWKLTTTYYSTTNEPGGRSSAVIPALAVTTGPP